MIRRRFVNLVVDNYVTGERSLHRLDAAKHLFYPSTAKAEAAHDAKKNNNGVRTTPPEIGTLRRLPPPTMNIGTFPTSDRPWLLDDTFLLLSPRTSDGRILHTNSEKGFTHIYDANTGSKPPRPPYPPSNGEEEKERVYAISNYCNDHSFEVLDLSQNPHKWEPLPLPPCAKSNIRSFTVVDGGSTICVSTERKGTYCFDTRSLEWRKAGDWVLPFQGRAEYVPELGAWFSIIQSYNSARLCAYSDLSATAAMAAAHREPMLQHEWEYLELPYESEYIELKGRLRGIILHMSRYWTTSAVDIINLGGGRFCIATVISDDRRVSLEFESDTTTKAEFIVLSGVEVIRGGASDGEEEGGGLRMVKHKAKRYMFRGNKIQCVL
ncbi:unnamed protein product [Urochloa decumbens]|uniref:Uncharacterized protein n=1 Tax=Urochloa decumbens TaxID=240449 RepID=A0ABC9FP16_9POAL